MPAPAEDVPSSLFMAEMRRRCRRTVGWYPRCPGSQPAAHP